MDSEAEFEILVGSHAVWVNTADGYCIGRFGMFGIDVHHTLQNATAGSQCLACTHGRTTRDDWQRFRKLMLVHHAVAVPAGALPGFLRRSTNTRPPNQSLPDGPLLA